MKLDDDHDFADSKSGSKAHIVAFDSPPSSLVLGSKHYDADTHRRALCGTISEMSTTDEPDDRSGYCYSCVRTGVARGYVTDPSPFDPEDVRDAKDTQATDTTTRTMPRDNNPTTRSSADGKEPRDNMPTTRKKTGRSTDPGDEVCPTCGSTSSTTRNVPRKNDEPFAAEVCDECGYVFDDDGPTHADKA